MGGGAHFLKRIPRIKFPQRHPKSSASGSTSHTQDASSASLGSDVPAPLKNPGVGGKASLQPERTPVTAREIDAIISGGCI
ncbi:hypothetical protein RchiOBHm_Chr1g0381011 [Rosa chinensis]|uniref:Uncharacterized protein n=1 Tax=Rosa chinensis TaxID=74649 RepID=A0A2P6SP19_ROSCH|nr:uncharacterized protein LOC112183490 [Rosa chinensis]PRQ60421.1 hypothetical protein RchiOBHm_Chr1g0381011 [Rosa chinensis]